MDARIEAEAAVLTFSFEKAEVIVTVKVDLPVLALVGFFDAASILASLLSQGLCSVSAISPDYIFEGEVSGQVLLG
jgi:hypothetical protein